MEYIVLCRVPNIIVSISCVHIFHAFLGVLGSGASWRKRASASFVFDSTTPRERKMGGAIVCTCASTSTVSVFG